MKIRARTVEHAALPVLLEGDLDAMRAQMLKCNRVFVVRDSESDCAADMQQGLVDAVSTDDAILAGLGTQAGYARVIGQPFSDEPYGLAMQQGHPEFVAFVNGVLSQMKTSGEWKANYERYLSAGLTPGQPAP